MFPVPYRPYEQNCSIAGALEVLGERWTLLVLREVLLGRRRFTDLKRNVGVAPNILSDRLDTLVHHGLLERDGEEYVPTRKGVDVNPVLMALMGWGDKHAAPGGAPRVVVHTACGHDAKPRMHCSHCGDAIRPRDVQVRPGPGADAQQRADGVLPAR